MKVLKILFNTEFNLLSYKLANYLIDSGHFVCVMNSNSEELLKWKNNFKYNLIIINEDSQLINTLDYKVNFKYEITKKLANINFYISYEDKRLFIASILNNNTFIFSKTIVVNNLFTSAQENLEYFLNEVTEVFIDSVIILSKSSILHKLEFNFLQDNLITKLLDLIYISNDLCNKYQVSNDMDFKFNLQSILILPIKQNTQYINCEVCSKKFVLSNVELEIFSLVLLYLLNARKRGVYEYISCFSNLNSVSKIIEITDSNSYEDLKKQVTEEVYNLFNNFLVGEFLNKNKSNSSTVTSDIIVTYNYNYNKNNSALNICYNSEDKKIRIKYNKDLSFFIAFENCLAEFFDKFQEYRNGIISLDQLTEISNKHVDYFTLWNANEKIYPRDKTVDRIFEEQVELTPDNIAVVCDNISLSYKELNEKANRLGHYLREHYQIKSDDLIALCLDRSEYMLIAILGVLKSGGAYVPIDPSYPDERIKYILEDTKAAVILTNDNNSNKISKLFEEVNCTRNGIVAIDNKDLQAKLSLYPTSNLEPISNSRNLAYVIYTSGTTGAPKGVMIEHKGIVNSCYAAIKHRNISSISRVLCTAAYVFDSFVLEVYPALIIGATLFILDQESRKDIYLIHKYCNNYKITNLFLTTKLAEEFLFLDNNKLFLNNLTIAGEKLNLIKLYNFNIVNEYGPTENTICTTKFLIINENELFIGTPIPNVKCYVLDAYLILVPIGVIGELYIGGEGLARGYLNQPGLTAERFIGNPFQTEEEKNDKNYGVQGRNARLYKTGDLVRWLPDGNIEYIGRDDFQVKINGYRIELGEIEKVLSSFPEIKQSIIIAKENRNAEGKVSNNKYLVGYYVADNRLQEEDISRYLKQKLPEYMIPKLFVYLDKLPLTINGKLDRKALPDPDFTNIDNYVAPRNELEAGLCKIWAEVLKITTVGIKDDFFALGGNSISGVQIMNKANNQLGLKLKIKDVFNFRNIATICKNL